jgi:hypothetical protein
MKSSIFCDITQCSSLQANRCFGGTHRLHIQGRRISQARNQHESKCQSELVSCLVYFSTLNIDATYSCETSVDFVRTARRYIAEDRTFQMLLLYRTVCKSMEVTCKSCKILVLTAGRRSTTSSICYSIHTLHTVWTASIPPHCVKRSHLSESAVDRKERTAIWHHPITVFVSSNNICSTSVAVS